MAGRPQMAMSLPHSTHIPWNPLPWYVTSLIRSHVSVTCVLLLTLRLAGFHRISCHGWGACIANSWQTTEALSQHPGDLTSANDHEILEADLPQAGLLLRHHQWQTPPRSPEAETHLWCLDF